MPASTIACRVASAQPALRSYRLVAFDLRGHGADHAALSSEQVSAASPEQAHRLWVRDLDAVVADLPPCHLVGWSFGSTVVQRWLQQHPDAALTDAGVTLACGPVVLGPTPLTDPAAGLVSPAAIEALAGAASGGEDVYARRVLARGPQDTSADAEQVAAVAATAAGTDPRAVSTGLAPFDHRPFFASLPEPQRRRLTVLVAEHDQILDAAAMHRCWQQAGVNASAVPGEGHAVPLREPARVAAAIAEGTSTQT